MLFALYTVPHLRSASDCSCHWSIVQRSLNIPLSFLEAATHPSQVQLSPRYNYNHAIPTSLRHDLFRFLSPCAFPMSLLYQSLSAHRLSEHEWRRRYAPFLDLSARVLENAPTFSSISYISPLTINFYFGALTSCIRVPQCDLRLASINPRQRRLAMLESSLTHRCKHCIGHVCLLGDVFKGSQYQQTVRNGGWQKRKEKTSSKDDLLKTLVRQVCTIPAKLDDETRKQFVQTFGRDAYDQLTSIVAYMGWLNFVMGSLGFPLESRTAPFAQLLLDATGVQLDVAHFAADDGEQQLGSQAVTYATGARPTAVSNRVTANFQNVRTVAKLMPSVARATSRERILLRHIPTSPAQLNEMARAEFGCVPHFVAQVRDVVLKRVVVFGCSEVFFKDEQTAWTRPQRIAMLFVFAKKVQNPWLLEDALLIARGLEADPQFGEEADVDANLEAIYALACSPELGHDRFSAALQFVYGCAGVADSVSTEVEKSLLDKVEDARSVVDVAGMLGFFGFVHRINVFRKGV